MVSRRIIHISKMTGTAGSERHLLVLLEGLRQRAVDARLWILVEPNNPVDDFVADAGHRNIPVERLVIRHHADPLLWWKLVRRLREDRPVAVHTHLIHGDLYGVTAARAARVPFVISSRHNDDKFRYRQPVRTVNRWLWQHIDAGVAISNAIRHFSIDVEHAPAHRVHTVHYGLEPATVVAPQTARQDIRRELNLPPNTRLIGSICRLIEQKGLLYGLQGFAAVASQFPDTAYIIAGSGPLRPALEAEAERLKIRDRIHFLGWREDAHTIFAALDVFLAPSLWEGFGMVFLEAMALSIPIIATRVSAIPEVVIDGETGWLVPPRDAAAIACALEEALKPGNDSQERGQRGRIRLETHFTVERMVEHTLSLYRDLGVIA